MASSPDTKRRLAALEVSATNLEEYSTIESMRLLLWSELEEAKLDNGEPFPKLKTMGALSFLGDTRPKHISGLSALTALSVYSDCPECAILESRYHADMRVYGEIASELADASPKDFDRVYQRAERAREAYERARHLRNTHRAEHERDLMREESRQG